jgi:hypothetical protein
LLLAIIIGAIVLASCQTVAWFDYRLQLLEEKAGLKAPPFLQRIPKQKEES